MSLVKKMCTDKDNESVVAQGNIAFAAGCVRAGIHAADGYPGTPSTEVIDKGLSQVQDMITVGWSLNEATAVGSGVGHTLAGSDCVVTMKIPGLFQAADPVSSSACYTLERGSLVYYIASDYTPSSTQHLIDPRHFLKSCFIPIFEPRNHQELHEAAKIAADLGRRFSSPVAIIASGVLCHSEGLVQLMEKETRERANVPDISKFMTLPGAARANYDKVVTERVPAMMEYVEKSSLNTRKKGSGKIGIITHGVNELFIEEVQADFDVELDVLSLGITYPLPMERIREFYESIDGDVYIFEDGQRYLQDQLEAAGLKVIGKTVNDPCTEWTPVRIAERLGHAIETPFTSSVATVARPPMICPGCPYRLFGEMVGKMRQKGTLEACFGDIGCNTLLHFMKAMDTALAMGGSEAKRMGYVLSKPESSTKCLSILGDGTECHSGLDATRNSIFRNVPGVKVILDNRWTAMTGGQPSPNSPVNLAGDANVFSLEEVLKAEGAQVTTVSGYDRKGLQKTLKAALANSEDGRLNTILVQGTCIRKVPKDQFGGQMVVNADICKRCGMCQICPGIEADEDGLPFFNNQCSTCGGQSPACGQMCPVDAISMIRPDKKKTEKKAAIAPAPESIKLPSVDAGSFPERLALAIRGVGGQGNLFFGRVMTQLANLAGYGDTNIVKGETHGMAQLGGPVISTFACGKVSSPIYMPGTADCVVSMERSEVLRPGFPDMLRKGGTVILAKTEVHPAKMAKDSYPKADDIRSALADYTVVEVDVLKAALDLGDASGRSANVVMIGVLSTIAPFDTFPEELWLQALKNVSPKPAIWAANYAAFNAGRSLSK
ncbi:pyruvate ferredoxin oxidoreductase [Pseudodesulfovibrio sp. JC047]|uniref:2-oxoacid:acceptor oxidoreductase family protein n=1 Tax=Pseudodesulfovibrio sp. JC047 TaxID=2683199 RepID=UPI0013D7D92D|nr:2-oxoacid:acceptor oxidoreductase family protein [Pseudodesulfovibrio sp. JC047]NDV19045.1 pyruvate ferredoxin oxidoreductase [Pseudodesulfovibrio sp. JC047]